MTTAAKRSTLRSTVADAVAASRRPPPTPQVPPEVRREQAARELAAAYRKIVAEGLDGEVQRVYLARGWPAVRQALAQARVVSEAALKVADPIVREHGLEGLGNAVRERVQYEDAAKVQAEAEPMAAAVLASLSPADAAEAARLLAMGGPEALVARAVALGVPQAAAEVAARTVAAQGLEGARQAATQHIEAAKERAAEAEASKRTVEEWSAKDGDPAQVRAAASTRLAGLMRDPTFHRASEGMAQRLVAAGVKRPAGTSAAEFVASTLAKLDGGRAVDGLRMPFQPHWTEAQRMEAITDLLGGPPEAVRAVLAEFDGVRVQYGLADRLAQSDAKRPAAAHVKDAPVNGLRAAVEAAAKKHGGVKGAPREAGNLLQAQIAVAAGLYDVKPTRGAEREIDEHLDKLSNPKPDTSVRGVLEAAMAAEAETEETEGGTDE